MPYWHFLNETWQTLRHRPLLLLCGFLLLVLSGESAPNLYPRLLGQTQSWYSFLSLLQQPTFWHRLQDVWVTHPFLAAGVVIFIIATIIVLYSLLVGSQAILSLKSSEKGLLGNRFAATLKLNLIFTVLSICFFGFSQWALKFVTGVNWAYFLVIFGLVIFFVILYVLRRLGLAFLSDTGLLAPSLLQAINYTRQSWRQVIKTFLVFQVLTIVALAIALAVSLLLGIPANYLTAFFLATGWKTAARLSLVIYWATVAGALAFIWANISALEWTVWARLPTVYPNKK